MNGWIFRRAVALKDFGERTRLVFIRDLGLAIREWVLRNSTVADSISRPKRADISIDNKSQRTEVKHGAA
jgi:hypothetical protein